MSSESLIYLILGSTLGVFSRLLITKKVDKLARKNILKVNLIASFFTGIYIALNIIDYRAFLFLSVGFLGCFSTFSSFIFHLFTLLQEQKYVHFFKYYIETLIFSFLLVFIGYFLTKIIFN